MRKPTISRTVLATIALAFLAALSLTGNPRRPWNWQEKAAYLPSYIIEFLRPGLVIQVDSASVGPSVPITSMSARRPTSSPPGTRPPRERHPSEPSAGVRKNGDLAYQLGDGGVVTDEKERIRVDRLSYQAVLTALSLGEKRFRGRPWRSMNRILQAPGGRGGGRAAAQHRLRRR